MYENENPYKLICARCGSTNVTVHAIQNVYTKNRGCLGWIGWLLLGLLTFGIFWLIALVTSQKVQSNSTTEAICQVCGNRWVLGSEEKQEQKIWPYIVGGIIVWSIIRSLF
jgi:hypothetical protein